MIWSFENDREYKIRAVFPQANPRKPIMRKSVVI